MLTSAQKSRLRSLAQKRSDDATLGKAELSDGFITHIKQLLARHEMIKVRFTDLEGEARKQLSAQVAAAVDAELITVVGKTMVLYRANESLPEGKRVL